MARGSSQATGAATSAQNLSNTLGQNAANSYASIMPELVNQSVNPSGLTPAEQAQMQTASEQSAGGSEAAAQGAGALLAARTRNPGAASKAIAESTRHAGETLSNTATGIKRQSALLRQQNMARAQNELQGLTQAETNASIGALGIVPQAVNANTNAENASWDWAKYIMNPLIGAAGGAAPTIGSAAGIPAGG